MSQSEKIFKYFVARKSAFLVVSLVGTLDPTVLARLEQCKSEIESQSDIRGLILHFADVSEISLEAIPILAQIQHGARARSIVLRLSGLDPELLDKLHRKGIIRRQELAGDLKEALVHVARIAGAVLSGPGALQKKAA